MTNRNLGSRKEMWGCIGTVAAAVVAGVFSIIVAVIADVDIGDVIDRLTGDTGSRQAQIRPFMQSTPAPTLGSYTVFDTPTPYAPEIATEGAAGIAIAIATATEEVLMPWEPDPEEIATPDIDDLISGMFMPTVSSCPPEPRAWLVDVPTQWYGPFDFNGNHYFMFDAWNFYTWDWSQFNAFTNSYGVQLQYNRRTDEPIDQWLPLFDSFFWVCTDSSGYLYAFYGGS